MTNGRITKLIRGQCPQIGIVEYAEIKARLRIAKIGRRAIPRQ